MGEINNISEINENTDIHEFAMFCKKLRKRWNNPQTEAEKFRNEIMSSGKTDEEWLALQKKVREFLKTATEEDKEVLRGYTESLSMICNGIREGRQ